VGVSGDLLGGYISRGESKQKQGESCLHKDGLRRDVEPKVCKT